MNTAVVLNRSARGLFIGTVYVPAHGTSRVDAAHPYLQELVKRGTMSILNGPGKPVMIVTDEEVVDKDIEPSVDQSHSAVEEIDQEEKVDATAANVPDESHSEDASEQEEEVPSARKRSTNSKNTRS